MQLALLPQVRFVQNITEHAFPAPPQGFPGLLLNRALPAGQGAGPLGLPLPSSPIPTGTAGPLSSFDPLPMSLVNIVQDLMLPGTLPEKAQLPAPPVRDAVS